MLAVQFSLLLRVCFLSKQNTIVATEFMYLKLSFLSNFPGTPGAISLCEE